MLEIARVGVFGTVGFFVVGGGGVEFDVGVALVAVFFEKRGYVGVLLVVIKKKLPQ